MDLNFYSDPTLIPKTRNEIRIESLTGRPYPDGLRLGVEIQITPFMPADRPSIFVEVLSSNKEPLASATIIESVQSNIRITMHLPQQPEEINLILRADLYYDDQAPQASATENIVLTRPSQ